MRAGCFNVRRKHGVFYLDFLSLPGLEDTVVALSVTGILKVWIVTSEVSGLQVRWAVIPIPIILSFKPCRICVSNFFLKKAFLLKIEEGSFVMFATVSELFSSVRMESFIPSRM